MMGEKITTQEQVEIYREWQKKNTDWELICDMEETEHLDVQWNELQKAERMHWVGSFREDPKGAFEEFGIKKCKFQSACLAPDLKMYDILNWQPGFCMAVFKTGKEGD